MEYVVLKSQDVLYFRSYGDALHQARAYSECSGITYKLARIIAHIVGKSIYEPFIEPFIGTDEGFSNPYIVFKNVNTVHFDNYEHAVDEAVKYSQNDGQPYKLARVLAAVEQVEITEFVIKIETKVTEFKEFKVAQ